MDRTHAPELLTFVTGELGRLAESLAALEATLAGTLDQRTGELLARCERAARHLLAARDVLQGKGAENAPPAQEGARAVDLGGSSRAVPIQDLLSFLASTRRSGVLRVEGERERFLLQLQEGAVVHATGDAPPAGEDLPELLRAQGVQSSERLTALPRRTGPDSWVDPNLVGTGWIAREALASAIQQQTRLSFFRMCSASHTRFRFYEGAHIQNILPVKQSAMKLLLEFNRTQDEGTGGPARAPAAAPAPAPPPQPAPLQLAPMQLKGRAPERPQRFPTDGGTRG